LRDILAKNMRRLRAARGLTQEALAYDCGINRTYLSAVERYASGEGPTAVFPAYEASGARLSSLWTAFGTSLGILLLCSLSH